MIQFFGGNNQASYAVRQRRLLTFDDTGNNTPMPTNQSTTPAWDPTSSHVPLGIDLSISPGHITPHEELTSSSSTRSQNSASTNVIPVTYNHVLLNEALIDKPLLVILNGDGYNDKEHDIYIDNTVGCLSIRRVKYRQPRNINPESVTPLTLSEMHDNGLLVVIRGEHCGKHVRCLQHKCQDNKTYMIVAVVTVADNQVDTLTGKQFMILPDDLCKADESLPQKELNRKPMKNVCTTYQQQA